MMSDDTVTIHPIASIGVGGGRNYRVEFPRCDTDSPRDDHGNRRTWC